MTLVYLPDDQASSESALARSALESLQSWKATVRNIPRWAHQTRRLTALIGIVRWYEQVCDQPDYAEGPSLDGLDALTDELTEARSHDGSGRLARARWAVRVAEELVNWRASRSVPGPPAASRIADSRLELAVTGARRQWQPSGEISRGISPEFRFAS